MFNLWVKNNLKKYIKNINNIKECSNKTFEY